MIPLYFMFYDPISDTSWLEIRSRERWYYPHETADWDSISSANKGNGNILSLMGLAPPAAINDTMTMLIYQTTQRATL